MIKLFEILIYSMTKEKFRDKWNNYDKRMRDTLFNGKENIYNDHIYNFPDPIRKWEYNQIIGYIVTSYYDNSFWFDLYLTTCQKPHFKTKQKYPIINSGINGYHFMVEEKFDNEKIIKKIFEYINLIKDNFLNNNNFIDTESLNNVVKIIDFTILLDNKNL